ncbi:hypothetical protein ACFL4P_00485 [Gemmatimonadota bacterium]
MFVISALFRPSFKVITAILAILWLSCGEDTIFEPTLEERLEFFPLDSGYSPEYSFNYNYNESYYIGPSKTEINSSIRGNFQLKTEKSTGGNSASNYKITSTFNIDELEYSNIFFGDIVEEYTRNDFTDFFEYDIVSENDTLWYVTDTSESAGSRSLMMSPPFAGGGTIYLKLFDYPGHYDFRDFDANFISKYYNYEVKGDTNVYNLRGPLVSDYRPIVVDYIIKFVRNKGVVELSIDEHQSPNLSYFWSRTAKFKLIE